VAACLASSSPVRILRRDRGQNLRRRSRHAGRRRGVRMLCHGHACLSPILSGDTACLRRHATRYAPRPLLSMDQMLRTGPFSCRGRVSVLPVGAWLCNREGRGATTHAPHGEKESAGSRRAAGGAPVGTRCRGASRLPVTTRRRVRPYVGAWPSLVIAPLGLAAQHVAQHSEGQQGDDTTSHGRRRRPTGSQ